MQKRTTKFNSRVVQASSGSCAHVKLMLPHEFLSDTCISDVLSEMMYRADNQRSLRRTSRLRQKNIQKMGGEKLARDTNLTRKQSLLLANNYVVFRSSLDSRTVPSVIALPIFFVLIFGKLSPETELCCRPPPAQSLRVPSS